jgi:NAD(P)H dehydrogenase (quinone)
MARVLIVYASVKGHTLRAAEAHAQGVDLSGNEARLVSADDATPDLVGDCQALILGSPIHMGTADWRMKRFIDTVCAGNWMKDTLIGRVGGVFVTGGGYGNGGGGADLCMIGMLSNLAQLGFIVVPLPRNSPGFDEGGTPWGPYCRSQRPDLQYPGVESLPIRACVAHGFNIATLSARIGREGAFQSRAIEGGATR